jgi:hypothetical protein
MPSPRSRTAIRLASAAAACLAACASSQRVPLELTVDVTQPGIVVSSDPPGAEVWIDGRFSGFGTPCALALDEDDDHELELRLAGYEPARRSLKSGSRYAVIPWTDGDLDRFHWRFPLFLPFGPALLPVKRDETLSPGRVHVRLRLSSES